MRNTTTVAVLGLTLAATLALAAPGHLRLISRQAKTFAALGDVPPNAPAPRIDKQKNQLVYNTVDDIHLAFQAGPESKMMSFEVDGLSNPEIRVPHGSRITLNVVNIDDDMDHNLYLTTTPPPYAAQPALGAGTVGTPSLAPHTTGPYRGAVLIFQAGQPEQLYYVCTIKGHAHAGMYGKLTITP